MSELIKFFINSEKTKKQIILFVLVCGFFISANVSELYLDFSEFELFRIMFGHNTLIYIKGLLFILVIVDLALFFGFGKDALWWLIKKDFSSENISKLEDINPRIMDVHGWTIIGIMVNRLINVILSNGTSSMEIEMYDILPYMLMYILPLLVVVNMYVYFIGKHRNLNDNKKCI